MATRREKLIAGRTMRCARNSSSPVVRARPIKRLRRLKGGKSYIYLARNYNDNKNKNFSPHVALKLMPLQGAREKLCYKTGLVSLLNITTTTTTTGSCWLTYLADIKLAFLFNNKSNLLLLLLSISLQAIVKQEQQFQSLLRGSNRGGNFERQQQSAQFYIVRRLPRYSVFTFHFISTGSLAGLQAGKGSKSAPFFLPSCPRFTWRARLMANQSLFCHAY